MPNRPAFIASNSGRYFAVCAARTTYSPLDRRAGIESDVGPPGLGHVAALSEAGGRLAQFYRVGELAEHGVDRGDRVC